MLDPELSDVIKKRKELKQRILIAKRHRFRQKVIDSMLKELDEIEKYLQVQAMYYADAQCIANLINTKRKEMNINGQDHIILSALRKED